MPEHLSLVLEISTGLTLFQNLRVTARLSSCSFAIVRVAGSHGSQQQAVAGMQFLPPHHHRLPQPHSSQTQTSSSSSCAALFASSAFPQHHARTKTLMRAKPNTKQSAPHWAEGGTCLFQSVAGRLLHSSLHTLVWQFASPCLIHTKKVRPLLTSLGFRVVFLSHGWKTCSI